MSAVTVTDSTFDAVVSKSKLPVLVDFWAPWCGPCKAMSPIVDQLAAELSGRAVVAKIDIEHGPEVAARFGVTSIPSFAVFHDGQVKAKASGMISKDRLRATFGNLLL